MYDIREHYKKIMDLGKGCFGEAWAATRINNQKEKNNEDSDEEDLNQYIIKKIPKAIMDNQELPDMMLNQVTKIQQIQSKNDSRNDYLMPIEEIIEDDNFFYIVSCLPEGSEINPETLTSFRSKERNFKEEAAIIIIQQVIAGVQQLHKDDIHVKNLKPNNIVLPSNNSLDIKITDTGFSVLFQQKNAPTLKAADKVWMAPEIIPKGKNAKGLADIWSIGAITYWLITG